MSEFSISGDGTGGPAKVGAKYVGKRPTVATYTNATPQVTGTDGYFTFSGAVLQYEVDSGTPATETNIQSLSLVVSRPVTPIATADSVSVGYLALGKVEASVNMTLLMDDHEAFRATFYGAVGGSTPSATIVHGSVKFNLVHSITGTHSASFTMDKVWLQAEPPQPDPSRTADGHDQRHGGEARLGRPRQAGGHQRHLLSDVTPPASPTPDAACHPGSRQEGASMDALELLRSKNRFDEKLPSGWSSPSSSPGFGTASWPAASPCRCSIISSSR